MWDADRTGSHNAIGLCTRWAGVQLSDELQIHHPDYNLASLQSSPGPRWQWGDRTHLIKNLQTALFVSFTLARRSPVHLSKRPVQTSSSKASRARLRELHTKSLCCCGNSDLLDAKRFSRWNVRRKNILILKIKKVEIQIIQTYERVWQKKSMTRLLIHRGSSVARPSKLSVCTKIN